MMESPEELIIGGLIVFISMASITVVYQPFDSEVSSCPDRDRMCQLYDC